MHRDETWRWSSTLPPRSVATHTAPVCRCSRRTDQTRTARDALGARLLITQRSALDFWAPMLPPTSSLPGNQSSNTLSLAQTQSHTSFPQNQSPSAPLFPQTVCQLLLLALLLQNQPPTTRSFSQNQSPINSFSQNQSPINSFSQNQSPINYFSQSSHPLAYRF